MATTSPYAQSANGTNLVYKDDQGNRYLYNNTNGQYEAYTGEAPTPFSPEELAKYKLPTSSLRPGQRYTDAELGIQSSPESTETRPQDESWFRHAADIPTKFAYGFVGAVQSLTDAFGADNPVSKNVHEVKDWVHSLFSAQAKQDEVEVSRILAAAKDKGVLPNIAAAINAFTVAPVGSIAELAGSIAPFVVAAAGAAALAPEAAVAGAAGAAGAAGTAESVAAAAAANAARRGVIAATTEAGLGTAAGAGMAKGAMYEATKEVLDRRNKEESLGLTPEQIEEAASKAQSYTGPNGLQVALAGVLGGATAGFGAKAALAKSFANDIEKKAIEVAEQKSLETIAERSTLGQMSRTAGKEAALQSVQGAQQQYAQNQARIGAGENISPMEGVYGTGAMMGLQGAILGGYSGFKERGQARSELDRRQAVLDAENAKKAAEANPPADAPPGTPANTASNDDINSAIAALNTQGKPAAPKTQGELNKALEEIGRAHV